METQHVDPARKLWVKERHKSWWDRCDGSRALTPAQFLDHFHLSRDTFQVLLDRVGPLVERQKTHFRNPVPVQQRVALAVWRLASADPLVVVADRFGLGKATCHNACVDLCSTLNDVMLPDYLQWPAAAPGPPPSTGPPAHSSDGQQAMVGEGGMRAVAAGFEELCGISRVAAVLYTCHFSIAGPRSAAEEYFNRHRSERFNRHSYSVAMQATVDHRGMFTDLCLGFPGSLTDEQILEKSALCQRANNGTLLPQGYFVVGARTYPLLDWLIVPYSDSEDLTEAQRHFNNQIAAALAVGRRAFARLKARWQFLKKRIASQISDLPSIIGACCVLHNVAEKRGDPFDPSWGSKIFDDFVAATRPDSTSPVAVAERDRITHLMFQSSRDQRGRKRAPVLGSPGGGAPQVSGGWGRRDDADDDDFELDDDVLA